MVSLLLLCSYSKRVLISTKTFKLCIINKSISKCSMCHLLISLINFLPLLLNIDFFYMDKMLTITKLATTAIPDTPACDF